MIAKFDHYYKDIQLVLFTSLLTILALLIFSEIGWFLSPEVALGDTDTLGLNANVSTSVSCSSDPTQTGFETLTTSSIFTATSTATTTMSCNYGSGCTLYVKDAGDTSNPGLYNSSATDVIDSSAATLSAGTEGYGIQAATTAAGSGGTLTIDSAYDKTWEGNDVGALALTNQTLTSSDAPISGRLTIVLFKAAISGLNKAGNYVDTITFECTGN